MQSLIIQRRICFSCITIVLVTMVMWPAYAWRLHETLLAPLLPPNLIHKKWDRFDHWETKWCTWRQIVTLQGGREQQFVLIHTLWLWQIVEVPPPLRDKLSHFKEEEKQQFVPKYTLLLRQIVEVPPSLRDILSQLEVQEGDNLSLKYFVTLTNCRNDSFSQKHSNFCSGFGLQHNLIFFVAI